MPPAPHVDESVARDGTAAPPLEMECRGKSGKMPRPRERSADEKWEVDESVVNCTHVPLHPAVPVPGTAFNCINKTIL